MKQRICLVPRLQGVGGMVSFQARLAEGLRRRAVDVTYDLDDIPYDAVLVIGGTRNLPGLWRARRRGIPVVQRLDGMNWLHRRLPTGRKHYLRAAYGNWLLGLIRNRLADRIVYQSRFAQAWWERVRGTAPAPSQVIHNAVDLAVYTPEGPHTRPEERFRLLLVEGSLLGGYEMGLENAVALARGLQDDRSLPVELQVAGRVAPAVQEKWTRTAGLPIDWAGLVPSERIPELDRSAHLLFSADLNPACPNAVIEALACGLPVVAFDTGALPELVSAEAGRVVPYGGDPWQLQPPDIPTLVEAAAQVLRDQVAYRAGARRRAEACFDQEQMVTAYLDCLLEGARE
jgi:glycosyltransferase involved in cell wall biosynthesis